MAKPKQTPIPPISEVTINYTGYSDGLGGIYHTRQGAILSRANHHLSHLVEEHCYRGMDPDDVRNVVQTFFEKLSQVEMAALNTRCTIEAQEAAEKMRHHAG